MSGAGTGGDPMDVTEKRARALLAEALCRRNETRLSHMAEIPQGLDQIATHIALAAIIAALTPPEGYVLVPVEPTAGMMEAAGRVVFQEAGQRWSEPAGHAEGFVIETQRLCHVAMLAARPEVLGA